MLVSFNQEQLRKKWQEELSEGKSAERVADGQIDQEEMVRQQKVMEELKNDRLKYHKFKGEVFNRYHNRNVIRR